MKMTPAILKNGKKRRERVKAIRISARKLLLKERGKLEMQLARIALEDRIRQMGEAAK